MGHTEAKLVTVNSVWQLPVHKLPVFKGESKTVKHNYVPARVQIERMYAAGGRLDAFQQGVYDYNADPKTGYFNFSENMLDVTDPTRQRHFDLTDYSELERGTRERVYNQTIEALEKRREMSLSTGDTTIKGQGIADKPAAPGASLDKTENLAKTALGGGNE